MTAIADNLELGHLGLATFNSHQEDRSCQRQARIEKLMGERAALKLQLESESGRRPGTCQDFFSRRRLGRDVSGFTFRGAGRPGDVLGFFSWARPGGATPGFYFRGAGRAGTCHDFFSDQIN